MTLIRTEAFVPLTPSVPTSSSERGEFQARVVSQPAQAQKFQSMESTTAAVSQATNQRGSNCEPRVMIQREGDQVSGIRIECSCGQVIDLACSYQNPAAPKA